MQKIFDIEVHADKYPETSNPYRRVKAQSDLSNWTFSLKSDCNASHYDYMHTDYFKALVSAVFNHEEAGIIPLEDVKIQFTRKTFGKQSDKRYMNPKNEGYITVTVHSKGVFNNGFWWLKKVHLKFFLVGYVSEQQFEKAVQSLLSPTANQSLMIFNDCIGQVA